MLNNSCGGRRSRQSPSGKVSGRTKAAAPGFTLIELIITMIILGFASLIMIPFITAVTHSPDPVMRQRAVALGQAMVDEIIAKRWDENTPTGGAPLVTTESPAGGGTGTTCTPCDGNRLYCHLCRHPAFVEYNASAISPDPGETRADYDDVDDYDGLTAADNFQNQDGTTFNLSGYSRSVSVDYIPSNADPVTPTSPAGSKTAASATDTKRITVTVTSPVGESFQLVALKCNY